MVFVPRIFHLTQSAEKTEYDLHRNSLNNLGYRRFLSRLFEPMRNLLPRNAIGLDFGSGPGPTLSVMFAEAGYSMRIYDPFYADDSSVWESDYNFITASEVVEHLRNPDVNLNRLWGQLKPNGVLGLMTKLVLDRDAFSKWHYKNDLTHVSFFSRETFEWLGEQWGVVPQFIGADVILFRKGNEHD